LSEFLSYDRIGNRDGDVCVILPSLSFDVKMFQKKINDLPIKRDIFIVFYKGFGKSSGNFPGSKILEIVDKTIERIECVSGKNVKMIIGDSYGGLIALGLLKKYDKHRYVDVVLTSPLISFNRLDKDPESSQSKEGFIRYIRKHELIKRVGNKSLLSLTDHVQINDPFVTTLKNKGIRIYHYLNDKNLGFSVSKKFSLLNGIELTRVQGNKHGLCNFDKNVIENILINI